MPMYEQLAVALDSFLTREDVLDDATAVDTADAIVLDEVVLIGCISRRANPAPPTVRAPERAAVVRGVDAEVEVVEKEVPFAVRPSMLLEETR